MSAVIKVENLSKQYRLGQVGTGTISHDVNRWWHKIRGKEDPYLKIGETNDRTAKGNSEYVWALKDINFEVQEGEVLGIIGRNGAGKSTLLKILSRTTAPTTGLVKIKGRVASLLEVGTGFHPELSGRDNIFLNGAILGMTRREIQSKFDEIVDFAGVERYIDTPVKRYSSGMYVRLAFAVAAHLEPEILIVDEVLAVGDAEFQKKCLGKMKDVSVNQGRTVLFVSHNISFFRSLCKKAILLDNGILFKSDDLNSLIEKHQSGIIDKVTNLYKGLPKSDYFEELYLFSEKKQCVLSAISEEDEVYLYVKVVISRKIGYTMGFTIFNSEGLPIISMEPFEHFFKNSDGRVTLKVKLPLEILKAGTYYLEGIFYRNSDVFESSDSFIKIIVEPKNRFELSGKGIRGLLLNNNKWEIVNN
jgi:lipopolysaccharide transport system ATP-binding protein